MNTNNWKQAFPGIILSLLSLQSFAQKIEFNPEPDQVTLEGRLSKSTVKVSDKVPTQFVVASKKGFVTYGKRSEEILEEGVTLVELKPISGLDQGVETRKVEFSKVADGSGKLSTSGFVNYGVWSGYVSATDFDDPKFAKAINQSLEKAGYNVVGTNTMFEEKGDSPELILACELVGFGKDTRGPGFQVSVLLDWSVYDVDLKKVVLEYQTGGYSDSKRASKFIDELVLAIDNGLVGLLSNPEFRDIASKKSEITRTDNGSVETTVIPKVEPEKYATYADMIKDVARSVVTVKTNFGHGSGFIISESGLILTNHHVVIGADEIEIIFDNGFALDGTFIKSDKRRDVALIEVSGKGFNPLSINATAEGSAVGTEIVAIGTPNDLNLKQTVTKGIVSAKRELEDEDEHKNNYIQTDVSISPGNSGGPLVNNNGEVVGIVVSKMVGKSIEGLGFAVPVGEALEKLSIKLD